MFGCQVLWGNLIGESHLNFIFLSWVEDSNAALLGQSRIVINLKGQMVKHTGKQ